MLAELYIFVIFSSCYAELVGHKPESQADIRFI